MTKMTKFMMRVGFEPTPFLTSKVINLKLAP